MRPYASTIDTFGYRDEEPGITEDVDYLEDGNKSWVKPLQELSMATNMLGVCLFGSITLGGKPESWASLLSAVTGKTISGPELLKAAERVLNMERMINAKLGFDRKDDTLPKHLLTEPAPDSRGEKDRLLTWTKSWTAIINPWAGKSQPDCPKPKPWKNST